MKGQLAQALADNLAAMGTTRDNTFVPISEELEYLPFLISRGELEAEKK
jgi:hypothetical protein